MLRVLHTSDWHLGHTLRGEVTREQEHAAFLAWLLEACAREAADALVITGDVFDSATPPASAERMWFDFLAAARRARPAMDIVAIAGNHDSPARLGAAANVLKELGVHVIGGVPRVASGAIDLDRVLVPIGGGRGVVAAVPFVRPVDLGVDQGSGDALADIYAEVIAGARARRVEGQALIVTGHLYAAGADVKYLSERRVSVGGQESASLRMFSDDISYVALGHIHRAQRIGRDTIRYAGAPLPLSLDEANYPHQVVAIDFDGAAVAEIRAVPIPRAVEIVRVPARGSAPLADVLAGLRQLPLMPSAGREPVRAHREAGPLFADVPAAARREPVRGCGEAGPLFAEVPAAGREPARGRGGDGVTLAAASAEVVDAWRRPYLEVVVALERPEPKLRALVEAALEGKWPRLVQLHVEATGHGEALADRIVAQRLAELDPRDVFTRLWARDHADAPADEVRAGFDRLLEEVRGDREDLVS